MPRPPYLDRNPTTRLRWLVVALLMAGTWGFVAGLFVGALIVGGV